MDRLTPGQLKTIIVLQSLTTAALLFAAYGILALARPREKDKTSSVAATPASTPTYERPILANEVTTGLYDPAGDKRRRGDLRFHDGRGVLPPSVVKPRTPAKDEKPQPF